jgi:hypothetical protein
MWITASVAANSHFMWVISDIHLDSYTTHTMELAPHGRVYANDLDPPTFYRLLASLRQGLKDGVLPAPDSILVLGDWVGHHRKASDSVALSTQACVKALTDYFPGIPVTYTFGNNDSYRVNYGPAPSQTQSYYSKELLPHLRLISLNTVMFSPHARGVTWAIIQEQLQWLSQQLSDAESQHDHVLLAMHIPPGQNGYDGRWLWKKPLNQQFLRLVAEHASTIVGLLAAHTHKDEIKIVRDAKRNPLVGVYINPALSTSHGNAPAMRVYALRERGTQWQLDNYTSYFFKPDGSLNKLYDYKSEYCLMNEDNVTACLTHISPDKMAQFLSAGNINFQEQFVWPQAINLA